MSRLVTFDISDSHFDWNANGVGFHGVAKTAQRAGVAQVELAANSAATVATANATDLATSEALANSLKTQLNAAIADAAATRVLVNELRAALVEKGLIKGAA